MPEVGTVGTRWGQWWGRNYLATIKYFHSCPHVPILLMLPPRPPTKRNGGLWSSSRKSEEACFRWGQWGQTKKFREVNGFWPALACPLGAPRWGQADRANHWPATADSILAHEGPTDRGIAGYGHRNRRFRYLHAKEPPGAIQEELFSMRTPNAFRRGMVGNMIGSVRNGPSTRCFVCRLPPDTLGDVLRVLEISDGGVILA